MILTSKEVMQTLLAHVLGDFSMVRNMPTVQSRFTLDMNHTISFLELIRKQFGYANNKA